MRWRALQTGRVYVKQHPGDAQLSLGVLDELRDMVGKEGETFSNRVSTVSESTKTFLTVICCSQKLACTLSISHSLCSAVHNCDSLCRRSSRSPIMLSILLVILMHSCHVHVYTGESDVTIGAAPVVDTIYSTRQKKVTIPLKVITV